MSSNIFKENKFTFNKLFFNFKFNTNIKFSKAHIDEFWLFFEKYLQKKKKFPNDDSELAKYDQLLQKLADNIPDEWKNIDELEKQSSRFNYAMGHISRFELLEFRNVLLMFIDFNLRKESKKLEKLAQFQRNLPIFEYKQTILENIKSNSVVLIAGDTGCGKSTQVPQYLLQNGYKKICCTQPRRIACIALCNRLSYETIDEYGLEIGYQIRFEKNKTKFTKILFLTEGLLLRQMIEDPLLSNYEVIILDEIHERHLSSDFLLGAIKCLLHKRKNNLKVILMSATVNCDLFSNYFGNCLVIKVPGRLYPIKTEYFPLEKINIFKSATSKINPDPYLKILQHIDSKYSSSERGDVLVFLSGFSEIEAVGDKLKPYADQNKRWIILYLHSALPIAEQDKVFDIAPEGVRKCILSTNIAETSITIDGIRFVIDSGKVKEMYYESKFRMHRLQEIWISKASAEQRKGRAGRTGPGICFRFYSQNDYESFENFSKPEIQRVSLESLILNMISMGLNDVRKFPFIEAPNLLDIENTLKCLINYGSLDEQEKITYLGRILSKLPVDIPIGKMLIFSICINMHEYALSVAACLSVQSMTTIRSKNNFEMIEKRKSLISLDGDLFGSMNFYKEWLTKKGLDENTRSWCRKMGFEEQRFHEITKLRKQFEEILKDGGLINEHQFINERSVSKTERIIKYGEKKLYRKLKNQIGTSRNKKRRLLNINNNNNDRNSDDEETNQQQDLEWNLKEIKFNLLFDSHYFKDNERKHLLKKDEIDLVKAIIILSFYPQMAIADLDNSYHSGSDQIFHTKDKPFVVLHPSSVYFSQPDALKSSEIESSPLGNFSYDHNLLGYISFIETNKSYICNCYQIPAVHMLLLSAQDIDTNHDCSRIICDNWIEVKFKYRQDGDDLLFIAFKIRDKFSNFLKMISEHLDSNENNESDTNVENMLHLKNDLVKEIKLFMKCRVMYAIKRLLPADMKTIYTNSKLETKDLVEMKKYKVVKYLLENYEETKSSIIHSQNKGGFHYSFINYNCLKQDISDSSSDNRKTFCCEICHKEMYLSPIERVRHIESCSNRFLSSTYRIDEESSGSKNDHLKRYFCKDCDQEMWLTNIDILRHRKIHH